MSFIGEIKMSAATTTPANFEMCDGGEMPILGNETFFAAIGNTYGGDGETTFNRPDFRGKTIVGAGQGTGLTNRILGNTGGFEKHVLTESQLPEHDHDALLHVSTSAGTEEEGSDEAVLAITADGAQVHHNAYIEGSPDQHLSPTSIEVKNTGSNQAHSSMQPFAVLNFIIRTSI